MSDGNEILLYDDRRRPRSWTEIVQPGQCAVFLRDDQLRVAVGRDGKPRDSNTATCILFDAVDDAERYCRALVAENPRISCQVLDAGGPVNPPLLVVKRDHAGGDEEPRGWMARHRKLVIVLLIASALPLFWLDWRHPAELVLTIIGINLVVAALRLLLWELTARSNERQRLARLEDHRRMERGAPRRSDV